jgi:hypothetical protein
MTTEGTAMKDVALLLAAWGLVLAAARVVLAWLGVDVGG